MVEVGRIELPSCLPSIGFNVTSIFIALFLCAVNLKMVAVPGFEPRSADYLSLTPYKEAVLPLNYTAIKWWALPGTIRQPTDYESAALPIELKARVL